MSAAQAAENTFYFRGNITDYRDSRNILGVPPLIGQSFTGAVRFDPDVPLSPHVNGSDRISAIEIGNLLMVDTPADAAISMAQGFDIFVGILPFNPIVWSVGGMTRQCAGDGGITLSAGSQMSFRLSCASFIPNQPDWSIAGRGSYSLAAGGVPESSTWALMIVGFAAVGIAMRRQRVSAAIVA